MKTLCVLLSVVLVLSVLIMSACSKPKAEEPMPDAAKLAGDLLAELTLIDNIMATQITARENKFANEADIRVLLQGIATAHPAILTACYVDTKGILMYLEPMTYKASEGADISQQAHTIKMLESPAPVLSTAFRAVEGFATVALAHPLTGADQKFAGSLVLTLDTSVLPKIVLEKNSIAADYELWALEPDGMIVCDQDKEEIGLNLFTDPLYQSYTSLLEMGRMIVASPRGTGEYKFKAAGTETEVDKIAAWDTINLHGREWRVVLVRQKTSL